MHPATRHLESRLGRDPSDNRQPPSFPHHRPLAFRDIGQKNAMIAKHFIITKTFRSHSANFLRADKSLRDHAPTSQI
jgi:hypothetical protein